MKIPRFLVAACISLALAFTFSCSSDDGNDQQPAPVQSSSNGGGTSSFVNGQSSSSSNHFNPDITYGSFTDTRDNKTYRTVVIGTQIWMAKNLNFNAPGSKCGDSDSGMLSDANTAACDAYGRLYNWATAMANSASSSANPSGVQGVCPDGWHLPSDAEWTALTTAVDSNPGAKLKATTGWSSSGNGTDDFGFSALPGGNGAGSSFNYGAGSNGNWWSSTEFSTTSAYFRIMFYGDSNVGRYDGSKADHLFSVRCVKD